MTFCADQFPITPWEGEITECQNMSRFYQGCAFVASTPWEAEITECQTMYRKYYSACVTSCADLFLITPWEGEITECRNGDGARMAGSR